jgi:DNA-binding GntR family transcriptional regulator
MSPTPVKRTSGLRSQEVFERLEDEIVSRVRPPGSRLIEDTIAAELGVSRTPVREALRMLHRAGWLDLHPHAGAYVRQPSLEEVRDVFAMREVLESEAARLAAHRADDSHLRELQKLLERGDRAIARGDARAVVSLNSDFHSTIAGAADNLLLTRFLTEIAKQVQWHFVAVAAARRVDSWREHAGIYEAIATRDADLAARLSAEHSRATQQLYIEQFLRPVPA